MCPRPDRSESRSVKYEEVWLNAYEGVAGARAGIGAYLRFYNSDWPHQDLDYRSPAQAFDEGTRSTSLRSASPPELVPA